MSGVKGVHRLFQLFVLTLPLGLEVLVAFGRFKRATRSTFKLRKPSADNIAFKKDSVCTVEEVSCIHSLSSSCHRL